MEHQTQAHLSMLRQLLLQRQAELRAEVRAAQLAQMAERGGDPEVTDLKDGAERMQYQKTEDFQAARDLRELQEVDDALARMHAGAYGDCAGCGEAISAARLQALPFARLCAGCQAAREQRP